MLRPSGCSSVVEGEGDKGAIKVNFRVVPCSKHPVALRTAGRGPRSKLTRRDVYSLLDSSLPRFLTCSSPHGSKQPSNVHG